MTEPIKHHYVPRVYLQSFANPNGHLEVYDKTSEHRFHAQPAKLARKSDYNTVTSKSGERDRLTIESFYAQHEADFPSILAEIKAGELGFPSGVRLMNFAALQFIRSPATRSGIERLMTGVAPRDEVLLAISGVDERGRQLLKAARQGDRSAADEMSLILSAETLKVYSRLLEFLGYIVFKLPESDPLITCDNPCILTGIERSKQGWRLAANSPNKRMIFLYPLAPDLVVFGDTKLHTTGIPSFRVRQLQRATNLAKWLNQTAYLRSDRHVFSHSRDFLSSARLGPPIHSPRLALNDLALVVGKILGAIYSGSGLV